MKKCVEYAVPVSRELETIKKVEETSRHSVHMACGDARTVRIDIKR